MFNFPPASAGGLIYITMWKQIAMQLFNKGMDEIFNMVHIGQQKHAQKQMMDYQQLKNFENYVEAPSLQIEGLKKAGLNPALAMGQTITPPQSSIGGNIQTDKNSMSDYIQTLSQLRLSNAQSKDLEASANLKNIQSTTELSRNTAELLLKLRQSALTASQDAKTQAEKDLLQKDIDFYEQKLQKLLDTQESQIALNDANKEYVTTQTDFVPYEQKTKRISAEASKTSANAAYMNAITNREQLEINRQVAAADIKKVYQEIDNLESINAKTKREYKILAHQLLSAKSEAEIAAIHARARKELGKGYSKFITVYGDILGTIGVSFGLKKGK